MPDDPLRRFLRTPVAITITTCLLISSPTVALAMENRSSADLKGIDVSHWNGVIDWHAVANQDIRFTYIKATGGLTYDDPRFSFNVSGARANGIAVGAYHYAQPAAPYQPQDAERQASHFVQTMRSVMGNYGDLMPVLDVEEAGNLSTSDLVRWIQTFTNTVEQQTHRQVMLYTSIDFIREHSGLDNALGSMPLWAAYYDVYYHGQNPPNVGGWTHWVAWQYTDTANIPGVSGWIDLDVGPTSLAPLRGSYVSAPTPVSSATTPTAGTTRHAATTSVSSSTHHVSTSASSASSSTSHATTSKTSASHMSTTEAPAQSAGVASTGAGSGVSAAPSGTEKAATGQSAGAGNGSNTTATVHAMAGPVKAMNADSGADGQLTMGQGLFRASRVFPMIGRSSAAMLTIIGLLLASVVAGVFTLVRLLRRNRGESV